MAGQVRDLTYNKQCYEKEFIDFSFAGKHVSEFGWVAVTDGDRLSLKGSAPFEDITTEINGVDGQLYWGSRYKAMEITFSLATDGITERELQEFKRHFAPGKYGRLEQCKYIGRFAYARVSQQVEINVIPFRNYTGTTRQSETQTIKIHTNLYKGEATITFIIDEPFWQIPGGMLTHSYANLTPAEEFEMLQSNVLPSDTPVTNIFIGNVTENGLNLVNNDVPAHYYNPSTLDAKPIIKLRLQNSYSSTGVQYVTTFSDTLNGNKYDSLCSIIPANSAANDVILRKFNFTSPSFYFNLNRAIQIITNMPNDNLSLVDFETVMHEEIMDSTIMEEIASFINLCKACKAGTAQKPSAWSQLDLPDIAGDPTGIQTWTGQWKSRWINYLHAYLITTSNSVDILFNSESNTSSYNYKYTQLLQPTTSTQWTIAEVSVNGKNSSEVALSKYLYLEGGDSVAIVEQTSSNDNITTVGPVIQPSHALKLCRYNNTDRRAVQAWVSYNYLYV